MNTDTKPEPISPQATVVPVDFRDTNHPHYPADLESQPSRQGHYKYAPLVSKKAVWILGGVLLVLASLAVATFTGIRLGASQIRSPPAANITHVETVFGTTEVVLSTFLPLPKRPIAATVTTTMTLPLPSVLPEASLKFIPDGFASSVSSINWFPVASAFSWIQPLTTAPAEPDLGKEAGGKCMSVGNWGTEGACKKKCDEMGGKTWELAKCQSDGRYWKCVLCPSAGSMVEDKLD